MNGEKQNLKIWSGFGKTDPRFVKQGTKGMSAIDAYYMFQQATKTFGPVGIGWGYEEESEDYRNGAAIYDKEGNIIGNEINHVVRIKLWYMLDGNRGELRSIGSTPYMYKSKYGVTSDEEAAKKSLTDAIKKGLSMLGLCSDVYMGMFEDQQYVADAANEKAVEQAIDKDAEKASQAKALNEDIEKTMQQMRESVSMGMLEGLYKAALRKIGDKDKSLSRKLIKVKDEVKEKLMGEENENV